MRRVWVEALPVRKRRIWGRRGGQPLNGERVSLASGESADGQGVEEMGTSPKVRAVMPLGL